MRNFKVFLLSCVLMTLILGVLACDSGSKEANLDLRQRVRHFKLDNGMTVMLLNRVGAPVFTSQLKLNVGNIEEVPGSYGLAHFFEHMAFKGTTKIGSKDYSKEKVILSKILKLGTEILELKNQKGDPKKIESMEAELKKLQSEQKQYIAKNEFTQVLQENGGVGLNASTSNDFTTYYLSLPVNKMELWAYMESERFKNPVLREFFTEKQVVAEERRMRIDNTPGGQLYEAFVNLGFDKSPYREVVIGPAADIQQYTPQVAADFYKKYYIPARMVLAVVGNIDVDQTEKIIRKYFGSIPKKSNPGPNFTKEKFDLKTFPRETTVKGPDKPRMYFGFHRPAHPHSDDIIMDVVQDILCDGRTSRLYKKLVVDEKKASYVGCYVSIPGARLDSMFAFYAMPFEGHTNKEIRDEVMKEVLKFGKEGPTAYELEKVKNKIDADLVYSLQSNSGLASQLAFYEALTGDWKYIYDLKDRVHSITVDEVKTAIQKYFKPELMVTAFYEQEEAK